MFSEEWPIFQRKALAAALVERAVQDVREYPADSAVHRDAAAWLNGAAAPISAELACAVIDLDPAALREQVARIAAAAGRGETGKWAMATANGETMYAHECEHCARAFVSPLARQKYCTTVCGSRAYRARKRERRKRGVTGYDAFPKTCPTCERAFTARLDWAKYCSPKCAVKGPRKEHGSERRYRAYLAARKVAMGLAGGTNVE